MTRTARSTRITALPLALLALFAALLLIAPAAAEAKVPLGGKKWPGGKIKLYDATPKSMRWSVDNAIKQLNAVGAKISIKKVKKRKQAQLVIRSSTKIPVCSGLATLGRTHDRSGFVHIRSCGSRQYANYSLASITAHELGHSLGLRHATKEKCAMMTSVLTSDCQIDRAKFLWRCNVVTKPDLSALQKRYGKRKSKVKRTWCPIPPAEFPAAQKPGKMSLAMQAWTGGWYRTFEVGFNFPPVPEFKGIGMHTLQLMSHPGSCAAASWNNASLAFVSTGDGSWTSNVAPNLGSAVTRIDEAAAGQVWCFRLKSDFVISFTGTPDPAPAWSNPVEVTVPVDL